MPCAVFHRIAALFGGATVHGHASHRTPHLVGFSVAGLDPATLLMTLDDRGFRIGAGSLCSGRPEDPSPVLEEIGYPQTTGFRVSLGAGATRGDLDTFVDVLAETVRELQRMEVASADALARFSPPRGD